MFHKNIIFLFLKNKKQKIKNSFLIIKRVFMFFLIERNYSKKIVVKQVLSFFLFCGMINIYSIDDIIKLKIESNF